MCCLSSKMFRYRTTSLASCVQDLSGTTIPSPHTQEQKTQTKPIQASILSKCFATAKVVTVVGCRGSPLECRNVCSPLFSLQLWLLCPEFQSKATIDIKPAPKRNFVTKLDSILSCPKQQKKQRFTNQSHQIIYLITSSHHHTIIPSYHPIIIPSYHHSLRQPYRFILDCIPPENTYCKCGGRGPKPPPFSSTWL